MSAIKTIGSSGQIALGKQYAGQHVLVDEVEPGYWVIKLGEFIPRSEAWLHRPEHRARLDRAIEWAEDHPETAETDLDELGKGLSRRRVPGGELLEAPFPPSGSRLRLSPVTATRERQAGATFLATSPRTAPPML